MSHYSSSLNSVVLCRLSSTTCEWTASVMECPAHARPRPAGGPFHGFAWLGRYFEKGSIGLQKLGQGDAGWCQSVRSSHVTTRTQTSYTWNPARISARSRVRRAALATGQQRTRVAMFFAAAGATRARWNAWWRGVTASFIGAAM